MGFFSPKNTPENAVKAQIDAKLAFINDKYTEIGRFVKLRMADKIEEPEVKNLIAQIDATLEELKNLNEQLLTIPTNSLLPTEEIISLLVTSAPHSLTFNDSILVSYKLAFIVVVGVVM